MKETHVVNVRTVDVYDIYIGRDRHQCMHFGNPFSHNPQWGIPCKDRQEAVHNYRTWLRGQGFTKVEPERRQWILQNLDNLRGKALGCFCSPKVCHGDILIELLRSKALQQKHS
jgi:hypothetical protein